MILRATTLPAVERLFDGRPIIQKNDDHPWENRVTFNPACVLVEDRPTLNRIITSLPFDQKIRIGLISHSALCFLFYRAQGARTDAYDHTRSSIGLAVLTPDLQLLARHTEPVILPDAEYDNLGVEDARITRIGDTFVMMYTAYSAATPQNRIRIAMAFSEDLVHWKKFGLLLGDFNMLDNKNAMLFPSRIDGKLIMLHRPMKGQDALSVHLAQADELGGTWESRGVVMRPQPNPNFVDTWMGGGAPPLLMEDGRFLVIYHIGNKKSDGSREYDLGIAVADGHNPTIIVQRNEPLLRPQTPAETIGDAQLGVNNVVFVCGAYFYRGDVYFPYAGADSVVLGARISGAELERYLHQND
jgi:predicted GH43/DUF377 family glycosyl hydrolase